MTSGDTGHGPGQAPSAPSLAAKNGGQGQARGLGLVSATALVIGTIVGVGVFTMPGVLAEAGTSSLVVLAVVTGGAILLAVVFGQLTRRVPNSDGGLYAYARYEFGDFAGYLSAWCYWLSSWPGNAAIAVSWVFYVDALVGVSHPTIWSNLGIALLSLWGTALINLAGLRHMAWSQNLTVVLKFLPLLFVGVVGWFFVSRVNFGPFNASGGRLYDAIGIAAGVALFAFIGVESAAIAAKRVRNPARNVGRASVLGTGACGILYLLVSAAVMGLVPQRRLAGNGAPFILAVDAMFGHSAWAGKLIAAVAVVSGFGALIGWTLVDAELPRAAANDGLFPGALGWSDHNGSAWFAIVVNAALPSLLLLWRYTTSSGLTVFTYMVDLTVVTVAVPYFFSTCAQLTYLVSRRRRVQGWALARDLLVCGAAVLFSTWVTFAAGYVAIYQTLVAVFIGIIIYAFINAHRKRQARAPRPTDGLPEIAQAQASAQPGTAEGESAA